MRVAHEVDLGHDGGRDKLLGELRRALGEQLWPHAWMDCQWLVTRCERCRGTTCRDMVAEEPRHLPRPDATGEILGWDLKKIKGVGESDWYMLLGVDFCTNRVWAQDLDPGVFLFQHQK